MSQYNFTCSCTITLVISNSGCFNRCYFDSFFSYFIFSPCYGLRLMLPPVIFSFFLWLLCFQPRLIFSLPVLFSHLVYVAKDPLAFLTKLRPVLAVLCFTLAGYSLTKAYGAVLWKQIEIKRKETIKNMNNWNSYITITTQYFVKTASVKPFSCVHV